MPGKYVGPVRFIFHGDPSDAKRYCSVGRAILGQALDRVKPGEKLNWIRALPDGTVIHASSWSGDHTGFNIHIYVSGEELHKSRISGIYCEPASFLADDVLRWRAPFVTTEGVPINPPAGTREVPGESQPDDDWYGLVLNWDPTPSGDSPNSYKIYRGFDRAKINTYAGSNLFTLDWHSPGLDGYITWNAVASYYNHNLFVGDYETFKVGGKISHRYSCSPFGSGIFYNNIVVGEIPDLIQQTHPNYPSKQYAIAGAWLAKPYGLFGNQKTYLYMGLYSEMPSPDVDLLFKFYRREWDPDGYSNHEPYNGITNKKGWELVSQDYSFYCEDYGYDDWMNFELYSGIYFSSNGLKGVATVYRLGDVYLDDQSIGILDFKVDAYSGIVTIEDNNLLRGDDTTLHTYDERTYFDPPYIARTKTVTSKDTVTKATIIAADYRGNELVTLTTKEGEVIYSNTEVHSITGDYDTGAKYETAQMVGNSHGSRTLIMDGQEILMYQYDLNKWGDYSAIDKVQKENYYHHMTNYYRSTITFIDLRYNVVIKAEGKEDYIITRRNGREGAYRDLYYYGFDDGIARFNSQRWPTFRSFIRDRNGDPEKDIVLFEENREGQAALTYDPAYIYWSTGGFPSYVSPFNEIPQTVLDIHLQDKYGFSFQQVLNWANEDYGEATCSDFTSFGGPVVDKWGNLAFEEVKIRRMAYGDVYRPFIIDRYQYSTLDQNDLDYNTYIEPLGLTAFTDLGYYGNYPRTLDITLV